MAWLDDWREFLEKTLGFVLPRAQVGWIRRALSELAQKKGTTPEQLLASARDGTLPHQEIFEAILIKETRFFRDRKALEWVCAHAVKTQAPIYRAWCAGVSRGQEAWSLAMLLSQAGLRYQITGTDVSHAMVMTAQKANYGARELTGLDEYRAYLTDTGINKSALDGVAFVQHNLMDKNAPILPQHAIICQNVLIYLRRFDGRDIMNRFAKNLVTGGVLVLGAGEMIGYAHPQLSRIGALNAWQKIG